jgi:hypothetical protein
METLINHILTVLPWLAGGTGMFMLLKDMKNTKSQDTMFYSRLIIISLVVALIYSVYKNTGDAVSLAWVLATIFIAISVAVNKLELIIKLVEKVKGN